MMKKSILLTVLSIVSLLTAGCSVTSGTEQLDETVVTAPVASHITVNSPSYFPNEIVNPMIDLSFATMATEYKGYATYFNICQKKPDEPVCGIPYKTAMTRYKQAKSNHDVLDMLWTSDLKNIALPPVANHELAQSLVILGYLNANQSGKFTVEEISLATYDWMQKKGLPKTDSILLLHQVLVKSEVLKLKTQG